MRTLTPWLVGLLLAVASSPLAAWGGLGHRSVADVAEQLVSADTRAALQPLLDQAEAKHLADVANWADALRDQSDYKHTASYHFVNFPRGQCDLGSQTSCKQGDCIISVLERDRARLADRSLTMAERSEALKFLVHLVGDIHQPLHAGWFDDWGGNGFQVNLEGEGSNLHKIWDVRLPEAVEAVAQLPLSQHLLGLPLNLPSDGSAADWALESCRLIGSAELYPPAHKLSSAYLQRMQPLAAERMALAGRRLAYLLDSALAEPVRADSGE